MDWSLHTETIFEKWKTYNNEKKGNQNVLSRSDKLSNRNSRLTRDFRHAIPFFVIKTREMLKRFTFKSNKYPKLYQEKKLKCRDLICPTSYRYLRRTRGFCIFSRPAKNGNGNRNDL